MFLVSPRTKIVSPGIKLVSGAKFTVAFNRHNIDTVLFTHICFNNGFSDPFFGYGNFKNCMIAVQLYVIEDMVGSIADSRSIRKMPFGIYDFIRTVSQKKFCVYIPCRTGNYLFGIQFL